MRNVELLSSALATLMIASMLSGCGGGNVEPVSVPASSNSQTTADVPIRDAAQAAATKAAAAEVAANEAATAAENARRARHSAGGS
jgi:hypothetical protein